MKKIILSIEGMTCSACSNGLEKYLNKQNGVVNASVNLVMANAVIEYDEKILNQAKLEEFVAKAGFKSLGEFKEIKTENKNKKEKIKFIVFSILAILLMYISMGHMIGLPTLSIINPHENPINYTVTLLVFAIIFIFYGFDIIKNGYKNLIHATPNMDTLVGIGVLSSFLYSLFGMYKIINGDLSYIENLYFESTAIVIYFIKLGRYIDGISKDKTKEAIQKLVKITPNNATIKRDGVEKVVTIDEIVKGDIVVSKPGEKIAVDGEIVNGKAHLDESFITGESKPQMKTVGNKVIAGSLNYNGYIEYKAERIGRESTISEIVRLVLEATNTKAPIAKLADKVSGYFVPIVILLAIITFLIYLIFGSSFSEALITFVTILVIACPCSLGLATPLAIVVSEGVCASNGILVKKSEVLETSSKIDTVVFDKTGTLTYGKLKIAEIKNYSNLETKELMQIVGSVEAKSSHPISKAFESYLEENKISKLKIEGFEDVPGFGIIGKIKDDEIILGNAKILDKYSIENKFLDDEKELASKGNSIIYVAKNKTVIAMIGVNDVVRENVYQVIKELNKNKIQTIMLTGDNKETAEKIAKEIGITEVISNVLPSEKLEVIKKLKQESKHVMMCGDGINDSPALAISDVGVSVNSGTDIAMDSSDVILMRNDLESIVKLMNISKKTIRNIKQNLFWAFFYNVLMIPIAMGILKPIGISINPMIASLAMVLSSITVILNALRLRK
ncbi:MAG: copper-translocating P-type ATPase [Clostridia bacterium]|nr:copper-translocating P-type ATPase [Clostridia bacterium]